MNHFDKEMKLFVEIKNKYRPIADFHLVLDVTAYKAGREIIHKFKFDSEECCYFVNVEKHEKNKEIAFITSNIMNTIHYISKVLRVRYDYDKNLLLEFEDYTNSPCKLNRTFKHQMELLAYDLTYPKPKKPAC